MTRDQLVAHIGGELVGGNVVKNNVCYGRVTEGVFVLTPEGEAALMEPAVTVEVAAEIVKPAKAPKAKKSAPEAAPEAPLAEVEDNVLDGLPDVE